MEPTDADWQRLYAAIKRARTRRSPKRATFARQINVNDSTMQILEGARPGRPSEEMLDYVTGHLGWGPGAWRQILEERDPPPPPAIPPSDATPNELVTYIDTDVLLAELARRTGHIEPSVNDD